MHFQWGRIKKPFPAIGDAAYQKYVGRGPSQAHRQHAQIKISPVRDWRSTPLAWLSSTRDLDLDLGSGHTAYLRASLIDLYVHTKFHWNRTNFLWTDVRTDVHVPTDGRTFSPSNVIRSTRMSRPNNSNALTATLQRHDYAYYYAVNIHSNHYSTTWHHT